MPPESSGAPPGPGAKPIFSSPAWSRRDLPYALAAVLLIAISIVRIVPTYRIFNQTYDEPFHLALGMEWLQTGSRIWQEQPPLGEVAVALGPWLAGLRLQPPVELNEQGTAILYSSGDYWHNLTLARLGTLPFLVLSGIVIFLWGRRWFSRFTALTALLLFVSLPPVLGHAGLATVDIACTATVTAALYQSIRWLEKPRPINAAGLGICLGLAFLCKFSSIGFLVAAYGLAAFYFVLTGRAILIKRTILLNRCAQAALAAGICFLVLWAGYRFDMTPLSTHTGAHPGIDNRFRASPTLRALAYRALECPVPLTDMAKGVLQVFRHNNAGHDTYLLGKYSMKGWWYFFPVVLMVKTPLGFLMLAVAGLFILLWRLREAPWQQSLTALFPVAILLVCINSKIDLGVRHILPIYPLLALVAAHALAACFRGKRRWIPVVVAVILGLSVVVDSSLANPDYLAYFNQLAGGHPEHILAESDLDWGQDLHRLSERLHTLGIKRVSVRYFGTAPLEEAGLPSYQVLPSRAGTTAGYIAISARWLTLENAKTGAFAWARRLEPIETIGKSIYLFRVPSN